MISSQMIEVWKLSEKQDKHTTDDKQTMDLMPQEIQLIAVVE